MAYFKSLGLPMMAYFKSLGIDLCKDRQRQTNPRGRTVANHRFLIISGGVSRAITQVLFMFKHDLRGVILGDVLGWLN